MFHVTESNKLEGLSETFKLLAFHKGKDPFARRIVLVPSGAFKNFLKMHLAKETGLSISFGLDLFTYEDGLVKLAGLFLDHDTHRKVPTLLELTVRIQMELLTLVESPSPFAKELKHYLQGSTSTMLEKKLYLLSKNLAKLFLNYGRFAEHKVACTDENFQNYLFNKIFDAPSSWITRIDTLSKPLKNNSHSGSEIFVFAPFMTTGEVDFLKKISEQAQVEIFTLMPSSYLLDDQLTDREEAHAQKKRRIGAPSEKNAFIANYSRLFRETQSTIIDNTDLVSSVYLVEAFAETIDDWKTLIQNDHFLIGDGNLSLLKAFQTDLTLMRMPEDIIPIHEENLSIEVHVASSPYREIQILHNQLLTLVAKNKLKPIDIQVFAKDISAFEPYIKAVFGKKGSPLNYMIQGEKASPYPLWQTFQTLLELSFKRFDAKEIVELLECLPFRKKWDLTANDIHLIRSYIDEECFTWGENLEQKNAYYNEMGFKKGSYDPRPKGTKEDFERRLLERLILSPDESPSIDIKDADTIACWIQLLNALSDDFKALKEKRTLLAWSLFLNDLFKKYFELENISLDEIEGHLLIEEKIASIATSDLEIINIPCLFMTAFQILKDALKKGAKREKEGDLNTVCFSSLLPHHAVPSKVIALIGLEEGVFPANDPSDSLDLLKKSARAPFIPKNSDTDRFLFMEAILSAREFLYLSYAKTSATKEENSPSIVILDLFSYLDTAFTVNDMPPSKACFFEHQKQPFHPEYFQEGARVKNYSQTHFKESNAYLEKSSQARAFLSSTLVIKNETKLIEIKNLVNFFKNPLKAYLQAGSFYLPTHKMDSNKHALAIPKTTLYSIKRKFFDDDPHFLKKTESLPSMPPKLFRDLQMKKILAEKQHALTSLNSFNLTPADLFTLNLLPYTNSPVIKEADQIHYPGIMLGEYLIFGKIERASQKGLVRTLSANRLKDLIPAALELSVARQLFPDMAILFTGQKNEEVHIQGHDDYLQALIAIYLEGLKKPLLLMPKFLKPIKDGNLSLLENEIEKAFDPFHETQESIYLNWAYGSAENISAKNLIDELQEFAKTILEPL